MKIQVLSQSFYPDHSGIALYASDFAFYAAQQGHSVEVVTGFPFYPQWKKRQEDRRKLLAIEKVNGVKILRGYLYVPEKPTTFKRIIHEVSLLASASVNFFRAERPDVVVAFTTPILLGFLAAIYKTLVGAKLVINVQDFQLEAASSLDMTNKKGLFAILGGLEKWSYKKANLVTSISNKMYRILRVNKNIEEQKAGLWPNWIEREKYSLQNAQEGLFRSKHGIQSDDILIAYAGNVGLKQGLETLIELAELFSDNEKIKFFIIGEGAALAQIKSYAVERKVRNVQFLSLLNSVEYLHFLKDLDIFFLPQKKTETDIYFPSKLLGLMAAGKTILLSADEESELYTTVQNNNIGFVTKFGDLIALKNQVSDILENPLKRETVAANAQRFVAQFEKDLVLDGVLEKISKL